MKLGLAAIFALSMTAVKGQIASDRSGNFWITGRQNNSLTCGTGTLPINETVNVPCGDATVTKYDATGAQALFGRTFGGNGDSAGVAIATDLSGNAYVAGYTTAPNFPVTAGAAQTKNAGPYSSTIAGTVLPGGDVFVLKLNPDGSIAYSTFLGGSGNDVPSAIFIDSTGSVYVTGSTLSSDFPLTAEHLPLPGVSFIARIDPTGQKLEYSTFINLAVDTITVSSAGEIYVARLGVAVAKIEPPGTQLAFTIQLGSSSAASVGVIALDSKGYIWVGGTTNDTSITGTSGDGGAFLVKLPADGSGAPAGIRFGPQLSDGYSGVGWLSIDSEDNVYAAGQMAWNAAPFSAPGFQPTLNAQLSAPCGNISGFLMERTSDGSTIYSSYLRQEPVAVTSPGHILMLSTGIASFLADLTAPPPSNFSCPVNSASYTGEIVPGELITLFGNGIGPQDGVSAEPDASGFYPTSLAGVEVRFNGIAAPLLYVQAGQINTVVPKSVLNATIQVSYQGESAPPLEVMGAGVNLGVFEVINEDGTANFQAHPAKAGSIVSIYATGGSFPDIPDGQVVPASPLMPFSTSGMQVLFGGFPNGIPGIVQWAGAAPGLIAGITQVNVEVPVNIAQGGEEAMPVALVWAAPSIPFQIFVQP
jgi:uncharacterized protein (TIGR03437 family)